VAGPTTFHRVHPETCRHCLESDTKLSAGVPSGEFKLYKCKNNMWDVATPIIVGDRHLGNVFSGQFFFDDESVDYARFRRQARTYGFDHRKYLEALARVPRLSREAVNTAMAFFVKLAQMLSKQGEAYARLSETMEERDGLNESLRDSEADLARAQAVAHVGSWRMDVRRNALAWSSEVYRIFGIAPGTPQTYGSFLEAVHPDVVLLDLGLPVMSGMEVARELRQHAETATAHLVALTGWGQAEDRRQTREAGFDLHLTKPTDPNALERLLADVASAG
jgi:CheY-like chemotaxis protein